MFPHKTTTSIMGTLALTTLALLSLLGVVVAATTTPDADPSPVPRHNEFVLLEGHKVRDNYHSPLPHTYIRQEDLPVGRRSGVLFIPRFPADIRPMHRRRAKQPSSQRKSHSLPLFSLCQTHSDPPQANWDWRSIDGKSYVTHSLNQVWSSFVVACQSCHVVVSPIAGTGMKTACGRVCSSL